MRLGPLALLATLAAGLLAAPFASDAQPARSVYRIAFMHPAARVADMREDGYLAYRLLFSELRRLGYVEGANLSVDRWSAEGRTERFPDLSREAVGRRPDVIVAVSSRLVRALKDATTTIPVVGLTADPIAGELVSSLARPGGNITGFSVTADDENLGKQLEFLREALPDRSRIAYLVPHSLWAGRYGRVMSEAASRLGLTMIGAPLNDPVQETEYRRVFASITRDRVEALVVGDSAENFAHRALIVELSARQRLPAIHPYREFVDAGGLMAYAVDVEDAWRRTAQYVDRILKGANPGQLPYQLPTRFELIINLKTARDLGLTLPQSLLLRADRVIE